MRILLLSMALLLLLLAHPVVAGTFLDGVTNIASGTADQAGLSKLKIDDVLRAALRYGLSFVSILGVAALCYGGFLYITAFGDDKKAGTGKQVILYSIIGLIIIGLSAVVVNTVITLTTK